MVEAWQGVYKGVGIINGSCWLPYQETTFVTPPFAGYVSGHSAFSGAAAEFLQLYFGSDSFQGPSCSLREEGKSLYEPRLVKGQAGYVAGLTDIPNTGSRSKGYSPAQDVVMCWHTYTEAALQAGISRIMGGTHIHSDNVDGMRIGREVGLLVFKEASKLWAAGAT
ncbi:hypothetical protein WJX75_007329 [Coccomyxa subellipsoidea]|uniref:Phosphatidic acid phosphatase type 2/haloperoxidase domain-containing protein n=1 Tax=Coccomyxa subellipsoidea TaxID=248742 RepID=A0ABR2Z4D8_9CHLO